MTKKKEGKEKDHKRKRRKEDKVVKGKMILFMMQLRASDNSS